MGGFDHELQNVVQTGVGFLFILWAFNGQASIEQTIISNAAKSGGISEYAGFNSLAILYFFFFIGNFLAVPVVEHIGAKLSMVLGGICYASFQVGFLFLNEWYLYISSAVLGLGAGVLWTGQGKYLAMISTGDNSRRNSGILWAIFQASIALGGAFLLVMFSFIATGTSISTPTVRILYSAFTAMNMAGIIILVLLRKPDFEKPLEAVPLGRNLVSTFELLITKKMLLLAFAFGFTGLETSMWSGVYPTVISFTRQLGDDTNALIAIYSIFGGVGQIIGGCVFGILGDKTKRFGRHNIVMCGMALHLITFAAIFVNFPAEAVFKTTTEGGLITPSIIIALACGFLLGLCDSIWNTQLYAFVVDNYRSQSSQAFAVFKSYQALCACMGFLYSSKINLNWQLLILAIIAILGAVGFYICEKFIENERKISSASEESMREIKAYTFNVDLGLEENKLTV